MKKVCVALCITLLFTLCNCGVKIEKKETVENYEITFESPYGSSQVSYSGELLGGVPNGQGKIVFDDYGTTYEGAFSAGSFNGQGVLSGDNDIFSALDEGCCKLEGEFTDTTAFNGCMYLYDVKIYEGEMKCTGDRPDDTYNKSPISISDYVFDGHGKLYGKSGEVTYEGDFKNNSPIDIKSFRSVCTEYSMSELRKYSKSKKYSLVKINNFGDINTYYDDLNRSEDWELFAFTSSDFWSDDEVWSYYKYQEDEDLLIKGDKFTAYGILIGNVFDGVPFIVTLDIEPIHKR